MPKDARKEPHTADDLRGYAVQLRGVASTLDDKAQWMDESGVDAVKFWPQVDFRDSFDQLENGLHQISDALTREARRRQKLSKA